MWDVNLKIKSQREATQCIWDKKKRIAVKEKWERTCRKKDETGVFSVGRKDFKKINKWILLKKNKQLQSIGMDSGRSPNYVLIMGWKQMVFMRKWRKIIR